MKSLVAYFSATGTTKRLAENLAKAIRADIFEIEPSEPYTSADLDWMNKKSRSSVEMKNLEFRPKIAKTLPNMSDYDTIFVGFPIWWYQAPTIINTFLESYDFSNKTIVLFATSGGSGLGNTAKLLEPSAPNAKIVSGKVLKSHDSPETLKLWVNSLNL